MTEKDREILRAHFYGYSNEDIAEIEDITVEEVKEIIEKNPAIISELLRRQNG